MTKTAVCTMCLFVLFAVTTDRRAVAADECHTASGQTAASGSECAETPARSSTTATNTLSEKAQADVDKLRVSMRYLMSIGMQAKSRRKRDDIAAIYESHGVPLPDEYRNW